MCLAAFHQAELDGRIRAAWAAFSKYRAVFLSGSYSFASTAKLFNAAVSPVLLFACACWTMTVGMEQQLTTTRRKMLRAMLQARRPRDEEWVEFVRRTTATTETKMAELGYVDWVAAYRRHMWRFAGKVARASDHGWAHRLLNWALHFRRHPRRSVGRPLARWRDCLVKLAGGDWKSAAKY